MIEIKNLTKNFGRLTALNNVNLQLNKGECIALIGPNGCGKTTLIKSILGMVLPEKGEIFFKEKTLEIQGVFHRIFPFKKIQIPCNLSEKNPQTYFREV